MRRAAVFLVLLLALAYSFDYYNLRFNGPITEEQRAAATSSGFDIVGYAGNDSYIARVPAGTVPQAAGYTLTRMHGLGSTHLDAGDRIRNITVIIYPGEDADAMLDAISAISPAEKYDEETINVPSATPGQLSAIRSIPGVIMADIRAQKSVFNDYASPVLGADDVWSRLGLDGNSTIVAIGDTGLDTGNLSTVHLDFRGRVLNISGWCDGAGHNNTCSGNPTGADLKGHGTHVSGSVLGNGSMSGGAIKGMAYGATLFMQSLNPDGSNSIYTPLDIRKVFAEARDAGASLHTNSWGDSYHYYSIDARNIDDFSYQNKDFLILFAAGNSGPGSSTLGSQAEAKNSITVGSTGTARPGVGSAGPEAVSSFSSRGPASDGRYKPDLMAPGESILSTRSSLGVSCTGGYDSYYAFCSGTSMATPLTTGSATLVRDYLVKDRGIADPPSSMIKAVLVAGAEDLPAYGASPNPNSGFGRVNLSRSLPLKAESLNLTTGSISTGNTLSVPFNPVVGERMRVALVWTDPPCSSGCDAKALVNDLDLSVTLPDGTVFYGNSRGNASAGPDRKNNVEMVQLTPASGTYVVNVTGYNVPIGPQEFSLVLQGVNPDAPTISILSPANRVYDASAADLNFTVSTVDAPLDDSKCLYRIDSGAIAPIPGCANMTLPDMSDGRHVLSVYANDTSDNQGTSAVSFGIDTVPPALAITKPANTTYTAMNITLSFNASPAAWNLSRCWYSTDGGSNITAPCANNSRTIWLANGGHMITAYANDTNGATGSSTLYLTVNSISSINVSSNADRLWTRSTYNSLPFNLSFSGFSSANCSFFNASGSRTAGLTALRNGSYSFPATIPAASPNGVFQYTVTCFYPPFAGLNDSRTVNISYDNIVPRITALFNGTAYNASPVTLSYNVTDNMADVLPCNIISGAKILKANVSNGTARTESVPLAYQGRNSVVVNCADYAKNNAILSAFVILDSMAPKVFFSTMSQSTKANADGTKNVSIGYVCQEQNTLSSAAYSIDGTINGSLAPVKYGTLRIPLPVGNRSIRIDCFDFILNHGFANKSITIR